jgi:hypothetical protein
MRSIAAREAVGGILPSPVWEMQHVEGTRLPVAGPARVSDRLGNHNWPWARDRARVPHYQFERDHDWSRDSRRVRVTLCAQETWTGDRVHVTHYTVPRRPRMALDWVRVTLLL